MAETLSTLSIISFVAAAVFLALTILFWFAFKIPTVVGDLSGRTAKKSIAKMRAANEKSGAKAYKNSKTNAERGKLTGTIPDSGKLKKAQKAVEPDKPETGLLADNIASQLASEETAVLDSAATELLDADATGLLVENSTRRDLKITRTGGKTLNMIEEVILIHTEEVIE